MGKIISVVGAGGKTTYIELSCREYARKTDVLVSTTTKMRLPKNIKYHYLIVKSSEYQEHREYFSKSNKIFTKSFIHDFIILKNRVFHFNPVFEFGDNLLELKNRLRHLGKILANGKDNLLYDYEEEKKEDEISNYDLFVLKYQNKIQENIRYPKINKGKNIYYFIENLVITEYNRKFMHISNLWLAMLKEKFEYILIESDGSRRKPLKFPKKDEPVISIHTDETVGVVDISMIGKEVSSEFIYNSDDFVINIDTAYRYDISLENIYQLIMHKNGLFKNAVGKKILFINKLDSDEDYQNYEKLCNLLEDADIEIQYAVKM